VLKYSKTYRVYNSKKHLWLKKKFIVNYHKSNTNYQNKTNILILMSKYNNQIHKNKKNVQTYIEKQLIIIMCMWITCIHTLIHIFHLCEIKFLLIMDKLISYVNKFLFYN